MGSKAVLVVAIVKNERQTIHECVSNLLSQKSNCKFLFSDNHSSDGTFEYLKIVSETSSGFEVIQPENEISLPLHFKFLLDYAESHYPEVPYRILIGGDDSYAGTELLASLVETCEFQRNFNSYPVIALPALKLYNVSNPEKSRTLSNLMLLNSRSKVLRTLGLAIAPTEFGYYNFVLGLMRTEDFNFWGRSWLESLNERDFELHSRRNIESEYFASYKLILRNRVKIVSTQTMLKRQHNRSNDETRINVTESTSESKVTEEKTRLTIVKHQFRHSSHLIRSVWRYRSKFRVDALMLGILGGLIATLSNMLYFFYIKGRDSMRRVPHK